ncbi:hypothetical protein PENANT_c012G03742 [Penicillium antarcticum]|uniref:Glycosyl transferase family 25 domain-containing protein n=1 Tax=Penicillium antarcticum TaxID=416450 RepID=A0A1V6Q5W1_9EURO|nr:uncharacterized protein N7508_008160 [Penicillium antarcticum]KAJ5297911.1 hypothetical protein N7508_008160 [Penicillium antarcticum]OQD84623.1 hypothetical protein PENANT_c012G03742 [Penicillium antarcticum]
MASQLPNKTYKIFSTIIALFISYVLLSIFFGNTPETLWPQKLSRFSQSAIRDGALDHISNSTLGFEHVYAIGLKERTDKRDFLTVSASVSGFQVEWLDGVRPQELQQKALPKGYNLSVNTPSEIGCWRAHMNALTNVLTNSYSTALILEDDADWDVNIKSQLQEFAHGLHSLKGSKPTEQAPYGTDWDLLWIGGCSSGPDTNETRYYAIPEDPTVPSVKNRGTWSGPLDSWKEIFPEDSTRFVYRAREGCCTYGYAVSNRGARKILTALAIDHIEGPVDNSMSELCGGLGDRQRIECFAPFPNLIGTYRPAGPAYKDSDIQNGDQTMHGELSHNMVYSTRRNIHELISDQETVLSQWGTESWSPAEIRPKEFVYPRGYLVN